MVSWHRYRVRPRRASYGVCPARKTPPAGESASALLGVAGRKAKRLWESKSHEAEMDGFSVRQKRVSRKPGNQQFPGFRGFLALDLICLNLPLYSSCKTLKAFRVSLPSLLFHVVAPFSHS